MGFKNVKRSVVTTAVLDDPANQAPVFNEGMTTVRHVRENEQAEMPIGAAIEATDGDGEAVAYTKGGRDADSFDINSATGQMTTKAGVDLDYETKKIYTVIVNADDNTNSPNSEASITVTIKVIDLDEKPAIWDSADRKVTTEQSVLNYSENGTSPVIDLDAMDPEGVTPIIWSFLMADGDTLRDLDDDGTDDVEMTDIEDFGVFSINGKGELRFGTPPDFEAPTNLGLNNNEYHVVVQASDRGSMSEHNWFKVTVTVTDVDEPGVVMWTVDPDGDGTDETVAGTVQPLLQFQPGATLAATVVDIDDATDTATWKWYRGPSDSGPWSVITEATLGSYTLVDTPDIDNDIDVGKYLRAVASYGGKTASLVSPNPVQRAQEEENTPLSSLRLML